MKIVVGYDGSDHSKRALERAAAMAGDGDQIVVVASAEARVDAVTTEGGHMNPSEIEGRRRALEETRTSLSERGIDAETILGQGDPGSVIVNAAKDADLVIFGTRGLNTVQRLLMGSISSKVVHRAPSDVLVVR